MTLMLPLSLEGCHWGDREQQIRSCHSGKKVMRKAPHPRRPTEAAAALKPGQSVPVVAVLLCPQSCPRPFLQAGGTRPQNPLLVSEG